MALERKFEKYKGGRFSRDAAEVRVTINRFGTIYMNNKSYEALGRPKAVALYYNREDDQIALRPAYERFIEHFPVMKKQMGWSIHAAGFCRHTTSASQTPNASSVPTSTTKET